MYERAAAAAQQAADSIRSNSVWWFCGSCWLSGMLNYDGQTFYCRTWVLKMGCNSLGKITRFLHLNLSLFVSKSTLSFNGRYQGYDHSFTRPSVTVSTCLCTVCNNMWTFCCIVSKHQQRKGDVLPGHQKMCFWFGKFWEVHSCRNDFIVFLFYWKWHLHVCSNYISVTDFRFFL